MMTCRLAYTLSEPPTPMVLAAARGCLQLLLLLLALPLSRGARQLPWPSTRIQQPLTGGATGTAPEAGAEEGEEAEVVRQPLMMTQQSPQTAAREAAPPLPSAVAEQPSPQQLQQRAAHASQEASSAEDLFSPPDTQEGILLVEENHPPWSPHSLPLGLPPAVLATLEIGLCNTTGTLAQTAGLAVS